MMNATAIHSTAIRELGDVRIGDIAQVGGDATARLRTGMRVTVDGTTGNVEPG